MTHPMDDLVLPEPEFAQCLVGTYSDGEECRVDCYTADQMREYAEQAVPAEREACAALVENYALQYAEPTWAFKLTAAIRARSQA